MSSREHLRRITRLEEVIRRREDQLAREARWAEIDKLLEDIAKLQAQLKEEPR